MSFQRAARAALAGQSGLPRILVAIVVVSLAGLSLSCGNSGGSGTTTGRSLNAYVTLPSDGSVRLLHINGANGVITLGAKTPTTENTSPTGLALLLPSKKFLYVANSRANTISTFNVASDGSLTLNGTPTPAGSGPWAAVIDPSGKYLLVTNNYFSNNISVFSIDTGSGALSEVPGSPFYANANPTEILITPSGKFVYATNPNLGTVTAFTFSKVDGKLTEVKPGSPYFSGAGAFGLTVDGSERFLYVANPSASNLPLQSNTGNISAFNIDPNTGALTPIQGSPFASTLGNGPASLTIDPGGKLLFAMTPGSSYSIWCFTIDSTDGHLTAVTSSPFSFTAGTLFSLIDPSGNYLYIGSQDGTAIEAYTYNSLTGAPVIVAGSPFSTGEAPGKMVLSQ
jgi:6-phosphogluconolactonase (cycloisomerase 2 family)